MNDEIETTDAVDTDADVSTDAPAPETVFFDADMIKEIVSEADSNAILDLILSTVKLAIKTRKAEIKAETSAQVKLDLAGMEGKTVTVKAPASFGAPAISGVITRLGDKTFTIQTTAIATTTGKAKNLARSFTDFLGMGDLTASLNPAVVTEAAVVVDPSLEAVAVADPVLEAVA